MNDIFFSLFLRCFDKKIIKKHTKLCILLLDSLIKLDKYFIIK